jgi:hypothetical protein
MKKLCFVLLITFLAIGAVYAQNWGNWGGFSPTPITVEGRLQLQNGQIAISTAGNTIFFVPMLGQYIGFIDELREGSQISVLGFVSGNLLQPIQFTVNEKSYDLSTPGWGGATFAGYGAFCCPGCWHGHGGFNTGRGRGRGW